MKNNSKISIPYLIGITGSFGTGKSSVGRILEDFGAIVIDTDDIVRELLRTKNNVTNTIVKTFGDSIISNNSLEYIDRKALAELVFNNEVKRKKLESIIHPEVNKVLESFVLLHKDKNIIAALIPLLFECGLEQYYDEIWCVTCKKELQTKRLLDKGFTENEINLRINSQLPIDIKAEKSDFIIDNSGSIDETKEQVLSRLKELNLNAQSV